MKAVSLEQLARAMGGEIRGDPARRVKGVSTDTRSLKDGELFVALKGERYDGHAFLQTARMAGAAGAVVSRRNRTWRQFVARRADFPILIVNDSLEALGDIAAMVRDGLDVIAVGITGSTGKTCTKDFLTSILSRCSKVASPEGSYNNEIGVPLTVIGTKAGDKVLVAEMGARRVGDIDRLTGIVKPEAGIITNVGVAHLELFGGREAVLDAKSELARALPPTGTLFVNLDDPASEKLLARTAARVFTFGTRNGADYRARGIEVDRRGRATFSIEGRGLEARVALKTPGRHQVSNALAAAACASQLGASKNDIIKGLEHAKLSSWRMECVEAPGGYLVINDAYNANPQSMAAAIETLSDIAAGRRTIAVLGEMRELGEGSADFHREVGETLARSGADLLIAVGRGARCYAEAWVEQGLPRGSIFSCAGPGRACEILSQIVEPGDVVLVKASRAVGLEKVAGEACGEGFGACGVADD